MRPSAYPDQLKSYLTFERPKTDDELDEANPATRWVNRGTITDFWQPGALETRSRVNRRVVAIAAVAAVPDWTGTQLLAASGGMIGAKII